MQRSIKMKHVIRHGVFGAILGLGAAFAQASPTTFYFEVTPTAYFDYAANGARDPAVLGVIKGFLTYEPMTGVPWDFTHPDISYSERTTESGCGAFYEGSCIYDAPLNFAPVVTNVSIQLPPSVAHFEGVLPPLQYGQLVKADYASGWQYFSLHSETRQVVQLGGTTHEAMRVLDIVPYAPTGGLFSDVFDLNELPAVLPTGQVNFFVSDYDLTRTCTDFSCTDTYLPGSFYIGGTLTTLRAVDVNAIPEPSTAALLGMGLVLAVLAGRRQRCSAVVARLSPVAADSR